ncbi:hypothetical protein G3A43_08140 [Paraburkholderia aspalathi]|nr:hypothetical protein [Paraburkholderia aspalathi]MBK3780225.1 hypothetical protein [Paraburkholderia aspalathi]
MMMNWVFDLLIPLWPLPIFAAVAFSFFLPDRHRSELWGDGGLIGLAMWLLVIFWWTPAYMSQTGASHFDVPGFWPAVWETLGREKAWLHGGLMPLILGAYLVLGVVWAVVHFWIYARRLGQLYVLERDTWLAKEGVASLDDLTDEQKLGIGKVFEKVRKSMLYKGDFPLRPFQQKRFFTANVILWPVSLLCYLLGDLVVDVARSIWFALRKWVHARYVAGMGEYREDDVICRAYAAELATQQPENRQRFKAPKFLDAFAGKGAHA